MTAPELPIVEGGRIHPDLVPRVLGLMLWPNDELAQEKFIVRVFSDAAANDGLRVNLDPNSMKLILSSPPHPLSPEGDPRVWRSGELAGMQLAWLFSMAMTGVAEPSRDKARKIVECVLLRDGQHACSEKILNDAWRDHGSVAHLWAAFVLRDHSFKKFDYLGEGVPPYTAFHDFVHFLLAAEQIRAFSEAYEPMKKAKLKQAETMYRLPFLPPIEWHAEWPPLGTSVFTRKEAERFLEAAAHLGPRKGGRPPKQRRGV